MKRSSLGVKPLVALSLLLIALAAAPARALDTQRADVQAFIDELVTTRGLERAYVTGVLADAQVQQSILEAMRRPAEKVKPWHEYRAIFLTPERIAAGVEFYAKHRERLAEIQAETGVPPAMILGIVGVESYFGRITGKHRVVDALVTLGFEYPPRAAFFSKELQQAFLLAAEEKLDLNALVGSYAGAMGPPQFIPSSYRAYAVDGDGDGVRDLIGSWDDILASVANYFARHKWQAGEPAAAMASLSPDAGAITFEAGLEPSATVGELSKRGVLFATDLGVDQPAGIWRLDGAEGDEYWVGFHNLYVITRYNRSVMYALAAWQLGEAIVGEAAI